MGADMVVGSLIKNPGGGLAPIGGYICGTKECVERCAYRLSAPGLGQEVGANLGLMPAFYQGLFLAPTVVAGALKGAVFAANVYEKLGFRVRPQRHGKPPRHHSGGGRWAAAEAMVAFCARHSGRRTGRQLCDPGALGHAGLRLRCHHGGRRFRAGQRPSSSPPTAPSATPYAVYFQGGLTWYHAKLGILMSLQKLVDAGIVTL